jgi:hypothetical protein
MEKLNVAQAGHIQLNDRLESVIEAAKEKEADLYSSASSHKWETYAIGPPGWL